MRMYDILPAIVSIIGISMSQSQVALIGQITWGLIGTILFVIGLIGLALYDGKGLFDSKAY